MALKKAVPHASGIDVEYWRVTKVEIDLLNGFGCFTLSGYVNEDIRNAGGKPLMQREFRLNGDEFAAVFADTTADLESYDNIIAQIYDIVKAQSAEKRFMGTDPETNMPVQTYGDLKDAVDV